MIETIAIARCRLAELVQDHCRALGLRCDCPHVVVDAFEGRLEFSAFLPQFGGARGMLIDVIVGPDYAPGRRHNAVARRLGIPVSFVNPESVLEVDQFVEVLRDWGYRGRPEDLREDIWVLLSSLSF